MSVLSFVWHIVSLTADAFKSLCQGFAAGRMDFMLIPERVDDLTARR